MNNKKRVVITGMGIVSPNGIGLSAFLDALKMGKSGVQFQPTLEALKFSCQIAAQPAVSEALKEQYFTRLERKNFNSNGILFGVIAGIDAVNDAGITIPKKEEAPLWNLGVVFGTSISGVDKYREAIYEVDKLNTRRLGSTVVAQTMASGVSAYLAGKVGAGNQVTTNSSACATGTEALLLAYDRIANGKATQMLCGSCSDASPYLWAGFDAMRVITSKYNSNAQKGSRPMSVTASGFVPGSGAGALVLESLESAQKRGVRIYAEVLGGAVNNGGQRQGGTMTAPNSISVQRCISDALKNSGISATEVDYINGHLTATTKDPIEIENWCKALGRNGDSFPLINSLKGMIGHGLAASGSMEIVATILQLYHNFVFGNVNCEDVHPDILNQISKKAIPLKTKPIELNVAAKASFGFGDVNACAIFRKI